MAPLTPRTAVTAWQFAPLVSAALIALAVLYLVSAARVRRRHPTRPWPLPRTACFLAGLAIVAIATESSIGAYDDVLFSDHMIQHVLLIMAAPPLLVTGRPVTLLLHSWHNPVHTSLKRIIRSRTVSALTWPPLATALYCAVVAGTHTPPFMDLVLRNDTVHEAEHALYLCTGYVFFLPLLRTEPLRHRASAIGAFLMLLITMLVDSGTGVACALQSREVFEPYAHTTRNWGPGLVTDLHIGGYIMLTGSDMIMTIVAVAVASRFLRNETPAGAEPGLAAYNRYLQALAAGNSAEPAAPRARGPHRGSAVIPARPDRSTSR